MMLLLILPLLLMQMRMRALFPNGDGDDAAAASIMMGMRMSMLFPNGDGPNLQNHGSIVSRRPALPFVQLSGKKDERLHGSAASLPLSHLPGWSTHHAIPNCT